MKQAFYLALAPLASLVIIMLGNGFFGTFISLRITEDGGPAWQTGLVYSAFYAGMMLGSIKMEPLIRRVGHIRAFSIFAAINAAFVLLQSFTGDIYIWMVLRFFVGVAVAGLFIVIESWLLLLSSPSTRGFLLSIYMVALYTAQGAGQFLLNFISITGDLAFLLTTLLSIISLLPVCLMSASYPNLAESEMASIFTVLKRSPLGFISCVVSGMILASFYSLAPVYAKECNFSVFDISLMMGLTIFGGLLLQSPIGILSDIIERRKVIIGLSLAIGLNCLALYFSLHFPMYVQLLLFVLFGGLTFTLYPLGITYTCDFFSSASLTAVSIACLVAYGIGSIVGPAIASMFMQLINPSALFLYSTSLGGLLMVFGLVRAATKPVPPKEMKGDYIPLPRSSPQAYHLDPRSEQESKEEN